ASGVPSPARAVPVVRHHGAPLAFALGGPTDGPALICCNGVGVSTFFWDYVAEYFTKSYQVLVWDYRNHGASGHSPQLHALGLSDMADDLARVMDAAGVPRGVILGHSMGCQVIFEFYRLFPQRAAALVPMLGAFGRPVDTFLDPRIGPTIFRTAYAIGTRVPKLVGMAMRAGLRAPLTWQMTRRSGLVHPDLARKTDVDPYIDHMARLDPEVFLEFVRAAQAHDAGPMLRRIRVPTLVVAGERDLFTPRHLSVEMAGRIPDAELLEIPRGSHAALIEQPELINLRLEKFLRERVEPAEAARTERSKVSTRNGHHIPHHRATNR
ncbi:MAG: alpha/beta hydrolase, partial [Myxococcota bacterium]